MLHAVTDISYTQVPTIGCQERNVTKATRQATQWAQLENGGFTTHQGKAYQSV